MEQTQSAPAADAAPAIPESFSDPREAARFFASQRDKRESEPEPDQPDLSAERAETATAEHPSSEQDDAAPAEQDPGETQEAEPEAELPPIEPPRSWTKAEKERFATLPRETQEYLHTREQEREREFRRSQNEVAEQRKAIEAERKQAEQLKQQYENQAKSALQVLLREQQRDFPDIKTMDDVRNLATSDPLRYLQWQAHQQDLQVQAQQVRDAEATQAKQREAKRSSYELEQTKLLRESVPDFADTKKLSEARDRAVSTFESRGVNVDLLKRVMETEAGHELLHSAGFQRLIYDVMRADDIKTAAKAAVSKPVPPVQRPGARPSTNANAERTQALTNRLNESGSLKDAAALLVARRAGQRR